MKITTDIYLEVPGHNGHKPKTTETETATDRKGHNMLTYAPEVFVYDTWCIFASDIANHFLLLWTDLAMEYSTTSWSSTEQVAYSMLVFL